MWNERSKILPFVWETSGYDWFEAYMKTIEWTKKKKICGFGCVTKVLVPPSWVSSLVKKNELKFFFSLEFANSVMSKYFVERLWLWQSFREAHTCPKQSLSTIPWLPNKDSSTSNTSCSIFNFSGALRPTISRMWDVLLSPVPRLQVPSIENLTYWSFAARWKKTKVLKHLVTVSEEAPSTTS